MSELPANDPIKYTEWASYVHWHIYADCPQLAGKKIEGGGREFLATKGLRREDVCQECMARRRATPPVTLAQAKEVVLEHVAKKTGLEYQDGHSL